MAPGEWIGFARAHSKNNNGQSSGQGNGSNKDRSEVSPIPGPKTGCWRTMGDASWW